MDTPVDPSAASAVSPQGEDAADVRGVRRQRRRERRGESASHAGGSEAGSVISAATAGGDAGGGDDAAATTGRAARRAGRRRGAAGADVTSPPAVDPPAGGMDAPASQPVAEVAADAPVAAIADEAAAVAAPPPDVPAATPSSTAPLLSPATPQPGMWRASGGQSSWMSSVAEWYQKLHTATGMGSGGLRPLPPPASEPWTDPQRLQQRATGQRVALHPPHGSNLGVSISGPVLALRIHNLQGMLSDPYAIKPIVRVHVVDATTGRYLRPACVLTPTQYPSAPAVMPHDMLTPPPAPAQSLLTRIFCACRRSGGRRDALPSREAAHIPARDDVLEPLATCKALNIGIETDVRALASVATSDAAVDSSDSRAAAATRDRIAGSDSALLWNDTLVLPIPLAEVMQPHVLILFEVVDDTVSLPRAALEAGHGYYRIAWGFLRPVGDGGKPNVDVDARVPLGFADDAIRSIVPDGSAPARVHTHVESIPALTLGLYSYAVEAWSDVRHHNDTLRDVAHVQAGASPATPIIIPVQDVPSPHVMLHFRARNRVLAPQRLRVSAFGALVPSVRYVHAQPRMCTYTYIHDEGRALVYGSDTAPYHHHHRRRHRRASIAMDAPTRTHGHSYRQHPALLRPPIAIRLPTDVPVSEPVFMAADAGRAAPAPIIVDTPIPDAATAGMAAARRSRLARGPKDACVPPDLFIASLPTGKAGALAVSFSPDGALLAVACADDQQFPVRIYDVDSYDELACLQGHGGIVHDISWHASSQWLISASADGTARVWFTPHASPARSPRAAAAPTPVAALPSIPTRAAAACTLTPPSYVYVARFHPVSHNAVVTGSFDHALRVWRLPFATNARNQDQALLEALSAPRGSHAPIHDAACTGFLGADPRDATPLASTMSARGAPGSSGSAAPSHDSHVNAIEFDVPGETAKRMVTADGAGAILVWDIMRGDGDTPAGYGFIREMRPAALRGVAIVAIRMRPGLGHMAVLAQGNFLRLFDLTSFSAVRSFPNAHCDTSKIDVCFSPDGRLLAAGAEDGALAVWDVDTGAPVPLRARVEGGRSARIAYPSTMYGVAWHPTQHLLATAAFGAPFPVMLVGHESV